MMLDDERSVRSGFTHNELSSSSTQQPVTPQAALEVTTVADVVDANDGVLSLREAIDVANASTGLDTITFADSIRGGTIVLTGDLPTITDSVVIDGDPLDRGAGGIVIDGGLPGSYLTQGTVFRVVNADARFEDLTLTNAYSGGITSVESALSLARVEVSEIITEFISYGIRVDGGSLLVVDSVIEDFGGSLYYGYGIKMDNAAEVTVLDTRILDIPGYGIGGSGTLTVERSTIAEIGGDYGRGIALVGSVKLIDSTITRSGSTLNVGGSAGAIRIAGEIKLTTSPQPSGRLDRLVARA